MKAAYGGLSAFVKAASGIVLEEGKEYLVESRLAPVARQFGAPDVPRLVEKLEATRDPALSRAIVEALTTNETYFFRDRAPFDLFIRNILPEVMKARADERVIRIWCAACATGQEPYSLAMLLDEASRQLTGWRVELLATDISTAALEAARAAS